MSNGSTNATSNTSLSLFSEFVLISDTLLPSIISTASRETKLPLPLFLLIIPAFSSSSNARIAVIRLTPNSFVILSSVTNGTSYSKSPDLIRSLNLSITCIYSGFLSDICIFLQNNIS